jgi:AcrR family transcriptional regulator
VNKTSASRPVHKKKKTQRKRFSPEERKQMILEGAINYFAEFGFDGRTRDFAEYLGISQSLIFRYFPTTASLFDRVYEIVFVNRWDNNWEKTIADRTIPLEDRLKLFYKDYNRRIDRYDSIRIALFSALRGENISSRYFKRLRERLIHPIIAECRDTLGLPELETLPIIPNEEQIIFSLHATVAYGIMRKHIFHMPSPEDADFLIEIYVDTFMRSAKDTFDSIHNSYANNADN